jgi:hypothetical protein
MGALRDVIEIYSEGAAESGNKHVRKYIAEQPLAIGLGNWPNLIISQVEGLWPWVEFRAPEA